MKIFYGRGAYKRDNGNLPELRLKNMFIEAVKSDEDGVALLSRKGLSEHAEYGNGPIRAIFKADGVFGGRTLVVSGDAFYDAGTFKGTVAGGGHVSIAASAEEVAVTAGEKLYRYGTGAGVFEEVSTPFTACRKILFHDGIFIAIAGDTAGSERWYFSEVLEASTWGALDFASAERKPDPLLDAATVNDTLWLFGSETIEPWANTGDSDAPYQRFEQRIFTKGLHSTGAMVELDNSLLFVGSDGIVYRLAEVPQRVSDHGIEERIGASETVSCFGYVDDGHTFLCVRLDTSTFAYDIATNEWCELSTYGRTNFRARCAVNDGTTVLLGDDETGQVWTFDGWADDGAALERLFTVAIPIQGGTLTVDKLVIDANTGWTSLLAGQGSDPVAELRPSRTAGATFDDWESSEMGAQGNYRTKTEWRALGMFDFPGFLAEIRVSDPVPLRISGVFINEAGGGRSR